MDRYTAAALVTFAADLLKAGGLDADKCTLVAELLVEADLMGHDTHGLAQLPPYLDALSNGTLVGQGDAEVVSDRGAVAVWDGGWRSGVWLTAKALDLAADKANTFGTGVVTIRRSHHIACLQAYLPRITERGLMAIIACSDPSGASVAPFGGLDPVFTPDPIAVGIPTDGDPILIDMSSSITTNAMTGRKSAAGEKLRGKWLQDADGNATDDPLVLKDKGTLLPTGGLDHGHKGYGMALLVESLSQGLTGYGRGNAEKRWGAATYVQVMQPEMFAGLAPFNERTSFIVSLAHGSRPHPDHDAVRLPGENALRRKREALADGVALFPGLMDKLRAQAQRLGVAAPT